MSLIQQFWLELFIVKGQLIYSFLFIPKIMKNEPQYKLKKVTQEIKSIKDCLCIYAQTGFEIQCFKLISLLIFSDQIR